MQWSIKGIQKEKEYHLPFCDDKWYSLRGGILFPYLADIHTPCKGVYVIDALLLLTVT